MKGRNQDTVRTGVTRLSQLQSSMLRILAGRESALFLLLVFGVEIAVGLFVIRDLLTAYAEVERVYAGSVRGLQSIGELQYEAQETRRSTLYALTTTDGNLQVEYADQSREADRRVSEGIRRYVQQARGPREAELGQRLASDWNAYLRIRDDVLGSILEGGIKEAVDQDLTSGVPLFDRVRQDLEETKRLYDEQASKQLALVADSSRRSVVKLIGALGFALLLGTIAIWAIHHSKIQSALHLAKLQMDFVANVSHELRTPLAAILSAGQNITDGFAPDLNLYGSLITGQARQLIDLVDQILLFASMKHDKESYLLRPLEVTEALEQVRRNAVALFEQTGFSVDFQIQESLPRVYGDMRLLSRCLQNLIGNAVKYSGPSRRISVTACCGELEHSGKEIRISVQDQGTGISASELQHVFEPFYRSPRVVAAQIHGTGLGLAVTKHLVEAMQGRVSVVSEVGVGSVFTIYLPVADESVAGTVAGRENHGATAR
jgi:signal transduction histidine kinase